VVRFFGLLFDDERDVISRDMSDTNGDDGDDDDGLDRWDAGDDSIGDVDVERKGGETITYAEGFDASEDFMRC